MMLSGNPVMDAKRISGPRTPPSVYTPCLLRRTAHLLDEAGEARGGRKGMSMAGSTIRFGSGLERPAAARDRRRGLYR